MSENGAEDRAAEPDEGPELRPMAAERYADFRPAGEGGMGIVYLAVDTDLNREVAFKVVRPDVGEAGPVPPAPLELVRPSDDTPTSNAFATLRSRFLQEAWVTGGLSHPGIVPVYELGQTPEGIPYYTMRFVKGNRSLADAIEDVTEKSVEDRLALLDPWLKVCDTVAYAHSRGVIHRDLKPDNVALGEFGEVVLLDWGLAKLKDRPDDSVERWQERLDTYRETSDLRTVAEALGTPGYMAPEAVRGRPDEVNERSDVYSLGAMLFRILTGRMPIEFTRFVELYRQIQEAPPAASDLEPGVPDELSELCASALSPDPSLRPSGAAELAASVRSWQARSAVDREVRSLLSAAKQALESARDASGVAELLWLDRCGFAATRVLSLRPDDAAAEALRDEARSRRASGARERETKARRVGFRRAAVVALAVLALGAGVAALFLDRSRRRAEAAQVRAELAGARAIAKEKEARRQEARARSNLADAHAHLAQTFVREKAYGAARVAAAYARAIVDTSAAQTAQVLAESSWAPAGRWVSTSHEGYARARLLRAGGERVVGLDAQSSLLVWTRGKADVRVLEETRETPPDARLSLVVTRDGSRAFSSTAPGRIRAWDLSKGAAIGEWVAHPEGSILALAVSEDAGRIFSIGEDGFLSAFDAVTHEPLFSVALGPPASDLAVLPGHAGVIVVVEGCCEIRSVEDGALTRTLEGKVSLIDVSADGRVLLGVDPSEDHARLRVWDLASGDAHAFPTPGFSVSRALLSPDGRLAFTGGWTGVPAVWDLDSGQLLARLAPEQDRTSGSGHVLWTDERRLYTRSAGGGPVGHGRVREWSLDTRGACRRLDNDRQAAFAVESQLASSASGRYLAWVGRGANGRELRVWDIEEDREVATIPIDMQPWALAIANDGARCYVGDVDDGRIRAFDVASGEQVGAVVAHPGGVGTLALSPDGRRLISTGEQSGEIRIWDGESLQSVATLGRADRHAVQALSARTDERLFVLDCRSERRDTERGSTASAWDHRLVITDRKGGNYEEWATDVAAECIVLSRDGTRLVYGGEGQVPVVLDTTDGREIVRGRLLAGAMPTSIEGLAISADGTRLASLHTAHTPWAGDFVLRLWDAATGELLRTLPTPAEQRICGMAFGPDGDHLYTAHADSVRDWRLSEFLTDPLRLVEQAALKYGFRIASFRAVPVDR